LNLLANILLNFVAVRQWATSAGADFYERGMQVLVHRWRQCIANGGDYIEK